MKNILEENSQIPEMYYIRNKHNTYIKEHGFDYSSNILKKSVSNVLYRNNKTGAFLDKLEELVATMYEGVNKIRNIFYYTHNKYYNKHGK